MQNFDDIKNLWQQTTDKSLPSSKEIILQVERARKKIMRRSMLIIFALGFTFLFISALAFYYHFQLWTTRAGIIIILLAVIMGIVFNTRLAQLLLKKADATLDNNSYLHQLVLFRASQRLVQTKGISFYFMLLTTGIVLYMYEFAMKNLVFGITAYSITLAWIAFNWFYIRKKTIAKQEKEINEQISTIEKLISNMEG